MRGELAAQEWSRPGCQIRISKSVACFGPWTPLGHFSDPVSRRNLRDVVGQMRRAPSVCASGTTGTALAKPDSVDTCRARSSCGSHKTSALALVCRNLKAKAVQSAREARSSENALQGRKSAFKRGDDEAEVHEYLENCRRTPMRHGGRTLSEPGIEIWTPSNDLAESRCRES